MSEIHSGGDKLVTSCCTSNAYPVVGEVWLYMTMMIVGS